MEEDKASETDSQIESQHEALTGPAAEDASAIADERKEGETRSEDMEQLYAESLKHVKEGEIIRGRVVQITGGSVLIDVGYKSEGFVSLSEFGYAGRDLKVGDEVDVYLETREDAEGQVVLSKEKANKIKVWDEVSRAYENNEEVKGVVVARVKGGLTVDIGLKAFLPGSQVDLRPVRNLEQYVGKKLRLRIIKLNRKRGNIVLSRRVILEEERTELKKDTLEKLREGLVLTGVVKNITDYGAFVDLGGIDGLLHITDMSWGRVGHPTELLSVGDQAQVVVLKFDRERERVSLGHKQITPDPWEDVDVKYPAGSRLKGRVVSITDYGAFVELEQGVEGLVHISDMSWTKRVRHPSKVVAIGDVIDIAVLNVDKDSRRISLGIKQCEPNPWTLIADKYPVGSKVEGKVRNLTDFGAFLALEEGIDGLIHISDMSWTQRIKHPSEILKKGQDVEAVVLSIDVDRERLSLGLKQLMADPWENIIEKWKVGDDAVGKIVKITNFGAFAAIDNDLEGLIHISELSPYKVSKPEEVVSEGDEVRMKIIKIDPEARKLGLSIRAFQEATGEDPFIFKATEPAEAEREVAAEAQEVLKAEEGPAPSDHLAEGQVEGAEGEERLERPEPPQAPGETFGP